MSHLKKAFFGRTVPLSTKVGDWFMTSLEEECHQWIAKTTFHSTCFFLGGLPSKYWPGFSLWNQTGSQHKVAWLRVVYKIMKYTEKSSCMFLLPCTIIRERGGTPWNWEALQVFYMEYNHPVKFATVTQINSLLGFLEGWEDEYYWSFWLCAKTGRYKGIIIFAVVVNFRI